MFPRCRTDDREREKLGSREVKVSNCRRLSGPQ